MHSSESNLYQNENILLWEFIALLALHESAYTWDVMTPLVGIKETRLIKQGI